MSTELHNKHILVIRLSAMGDAAMTVPVLKSLNGPTQPFRNADRPHREGCILCTVGKQPFAEELKLISTLDLMISMDSRNGHLAANFGVPVLTIWGLTHPFSGFAPYGSSEKNWLLPNIEIYPNFRLRK